jgi:predicted small secreted protein
MFTNRMQRIGLLIAVLAVSAFLWGCGTVAPTAVGPVATLQPAGQDTQTGGPTDNDPNRWW